MKAKVLFEYQKQQDDELELKPGQIVDIINDNVYDGWMSGRLGDVEGLFPSNFVEIIKEVPSRPPPPVARPAAAPAPAPASPPQPAAQDPPAAATEDLVRPRKVLPQTGGIGDIMNRMSMKLKPVEPEPEPEPAPVVSSSSGVKRCKAHHLYEAAQSDEISFKPGDIIEITNQEHDDWWEGTVNGKTGMFPSNFVDMLPDEEKPLRKASTGTAKIVPTAASPPSQPAPAEEPAPTAPTARAGPKVIGVSVMPKADDTASDTAQLPAWKLRLLQKKQQEQGSTAATTPSSSAPAKEEKKEDPTPPWVKRASTISADTPPKSPVDHDAVPASPGRKPTSVPAKPAPKPSPAASATASDETSSNFPVRPGVRPGLATRPASMLEKSTPAAAGGATSEDILKPRFGSQRAASEGNVEKEEKKEKEKEKEKEKPVGVKEEVSGSGVDVSSIKTLGDVSKLVTQLADEVRNLKKEIEGEREARVALEARGRALS
eukprot:comp22948_c1_seq1/m.36394 comp22948_c1_seq1/g.36394  ORF comp22948_c1_seq1/g.36394 comp22948_c1_seq1/m.36394 type:complete len:488 (-) comp22948_c1_seq1:45-1508(-)